MSWRSLVGWLAVGSLATLCAQQPPPPTSSQPLRVEVQVVNVYCTVAEKNGRPVTNLAPEDFEVQEDGKRQTVRYFARETDRPLTMALLVDTSISQQRVLPLEQETASFFFERVLRPSDLAALITFDVNVDLLQDFTSEAVRLERALARAKINAPAALGPFPRAGPSGTRLFDAVYLASVEKLASEVGRKAIILVSDGVDAGSEVKFEEALEAAHRSDAMIYAIVVADPAFYEDQRRAGFGYPGYGNLAKLARETGGRTFVVDEPERDKLAAAFDAIATELRSQYSLGYTPTNRRLDGKFRKIEVKVKQKGLRVQARRGYYAPQVPATPAQ
ncbi:MAG: VWA domain-containing protein [Acidobacteria bacterium]|nr:VWA domain-containing protein [Acidobacteriota bacterium]